MPQKSNRPMTRSRAIARTETIETVKDAIGIFAILTTLYVGLFIPFI